jgi:hypothetical protein
MKVLAKRALLFTLIFLTSCVIQRSVVRQPNLALQVTDGANPLANVSVYLYWISDPYGRLEETQQFATDAEGEVRLEERLQADVALPLALHGVKYFQHQLCLQTPGYRPLLVTLVTKPGDTIKLTLPLTLGQTPDVCSDYQTLNAHAGVPRPDIKQHDSVQGAYEITP